MAGNISIDVCGPDDDVPEGCLKLSVSSRAPIFNPTGWKDLWRLSPFSVVPGGISVPGLRGTSSQTVENAWQFLKLWPGEPGWLEEDARAAFDSPCAIRFPRGRHVRAIGAYWGEDGSTLSYVEARRRIYVPAYRQLLQQPDRVAIIDRLRQAAMAQPVCVHDFDSYRLADVGLKTPAEALYSEARPFAHAFLVALAVQGQLDDLEAAVNM